MCSYRDIRIQSCCFSCLPGDIISAPWAYGYGHIPPGFTTHAATAIEVSWCVAVGVENKCGGFKHEGWLLKGRTDEYRTGFAWPYV